MQTVQKSKLRAELELELARRDMTEMCRMEKPSWQWDLPHIQLLIDAATRDGNVIVEFPVRHGKSETLTIRGSAHDMLNPETRLVIACHTQDLAERFSRSVQMVVQRFTPLDKKRTALGYWATEGGATCKAVGVGGTVIGEGFNRLRVDDPIKSREEAESQRMREKVFDWFTQDLWTRREPGARISMVMSRWHEEDLSGKLQSSEFKDLFQVLYAPAICDTDDDILGRVVGEAMWPERFSLDVLEQNRKVLGDYAFYAQYQQRPTSREGAIFLPDEILEVSRETVPDDLRKCRAWDFAATANGGDYTEGWEMHGPDHSGLYYIVDGVSGRWNASEVDLIFRDTARADGKAVTQRIPQDPGQAGKDQARRRASLIDGYPCIWETIQGSKVVRSQGFASAVNGGRVRIVRSSKVPKVKSQLRAFDRGAHDDIVDALTDAYNFLSSQSANTAARPKPRPRTWK